jgi:predicted dehydrogenase
MAEILRIGVVGCGYIGHPHAKAITRVPNAQLVAVADLNRGSADLFAAEYHAQPYGDYHEMLARADIDAVVVATPPTAHAEVTIAALEAGKHVLVQKPLALTVDECDRMIEAARKADRQLMNAFFEMYHPAFAAAKKLIDAEVIGRVFLMKAMMAWYSEVDNWRFDRKVGGGGILMDGHVHHAALFKWYSGSDAESVYSEYGTLNSDAQVEDTGVTLVRSKTAILEISGSNRLREPIEQFPGQGHFKEHFEIFGSAGTILIHPLARPALRVYSERWELPGITTGWVAPHLEGADFDKRIGFCQFNAEQDPWVGLLQDFTDSILGGLPVPTPGEFGRAALRIVLAAYQSGAEGRRVSL